MIAIDSSALLAILFGEPEKGAFQDVIAGCDRLIVSAVNVHETAAVLRVRRGLAAVGALWEMLRENDIEIVAFDVVQARAAAAAFYRYGKGIDSKARLNLCDCAAYALATTMKCRLLFKGADFIHTDVRPAFPL